MYGWLLESVQHYVVEECGEEAWNTILREAGIRNTIFNVTQQYSDVLMPRLAVALAQLINRDLNSPSTSRPASPASRKTSVKKQKRTQSVRRDSRSETFKCPFTDTRAFTAKTKKEMDAFASPDEIKSPISTAKINEGEEFIPRNPRGFNRRSLEIKFESHRPLEIEEIIAEAPGENTKPDQENGYESAVNDSKDLPVSNVTACPFNSIVSASTRVKDSEPTSPESESSRKLLTRRTSVTLALDVYRRRGSALLSRPRLNSLTFQAEKLNSLKEKFGTPDKAMHFFGRCFVKFFSKYKYDTMIRATGRYFCTFLQSVDNIHQRMQYTFPRMRSPSMQLTRAHRHGAELVYSSTRTGYTHYLMGQLYEIAEDIFSLKLKVSVVKESMEGNYYVAVLRLEFDNSDYVQSLMTRKNLPCDLPAVPVSLLLQLFPFGVLLDRKMNVLRSGDKLAAAWGGPYMRIAKTPITEILRLRKPKISFTWDKVVSMQTMIFELELMRYRAQTQSDSRRGSQGARSVLLRGPMYFLEEIDALIFLCSPIFDNIDELRLAGLYLADMNGHGLSKEMLLKGWQHLSRLDLLFEKAETRSASLQTSCSLLDQWKKRSDQLLYSMIPKAIADHLRAGKDPMESCQDFESASIIFCGVQLAEADTRAGVMQTVAYMNDVYSKIDRLLDTHRAYKVETVGTVYMLVSGAPVKNHHHAASAASAALAIVRALPMLTIGIHSGPCVAGVLGHKVPRYCLVGDSVNTASRMQTSSEPGRIQISSATASLLPPGRFRLRTRGLTKVKGKGMMETFWLEGELEQEDQHEALEMISSLYANE